MNFSSVLAFGDSHVAGCEIVDELFVLPGATWRDFCASDKKTKPLAFPDLVAKELGIPCYNYSMSGSSNQRNIRLLIEKIQQHPNSLVLFGYTSGARIEFYLPDSDDYVFRDGDFVQLIPSMCDGDWFNKSQSKLAEIYYKNFYQPRNNFFEIAFVVDSICKVHAKMCVHLPLFPEAAVIHEQIDNVLMFDQNKDYLSWCEHNTFTKKIYGHYGIDAHKNLKNLLLEHIMKNYHV
jgi:hypothetical protein